MQLTQPQINADFEDSGMTFMLRLDGGRSICMGLRRDGRLKVVNAAERHQLWGWLGWLGSHVNSYFVLNKLED